MESSAPSPRRERATAPPARVNWIPLLGVALGALFVSVFFENLHKDLYTADGSAGLIQFYTDKGVAPGPWKDVMGFIGDNSSVFAPLQAAFELTLGILLVLGIARALVALAAAGHLTALWVSEWGTAWVWELLALMIVALVVGVASLRAAGRPPDIKRLLVGERVWGAVAMPVRLGVAILAGGALWGATVASENGGRGFEAAGWQSGLVLAVALVALAFLDERRPAEEATAR
jgi:uncharacterized membrane protein YphA (DoxX/SURF4 family)